MNEADRVNGLSLLVADLVWGLVHEGRMSDAEAEHWERQAAALVSGDPLSPLELEETLCSA